MLTKLYTTAKSGWSVLNHGVVWLLGRAETRALPAFNSPKAVANHLCPPGTVGKYYTGDPFGGAADFNLHPERFEWGIQTGRYRELSIDCDDFATYAFLAMRSIPNCRPMVLTVRDAGIMMSHVVAVYEQNGSYGLIDTNGHIQLSDLKDSTICYALNTYYPNARYVEVIDSGYPFGV